MHHEMHLNLTGMPAVARDAVEAFASVVAESAGAKLLGLTFYGRFAGDADAAGPLRSVLVLDQVDLAMLHKLSERGPQFARLGIAAPLVMTPAYIAGSRDTFPLELLEIQQSRHTVLGRDEFAALTFQREHVRLQAERELKRALIRLRQDLLSCEGRDDLLSELVEDVAGMLLRTLRGVAWLKGHAQPLSRQALLGVIGQMASGPLPGLCEALRQKRVHDWDEFVALYRDVETLAAMIDATR